MGIRYELGCYNPEWDRRHTAYAGHSAWECYKAYRKWRKQGCRHFTFQWWVPENGE